MFSQLELSRSGAETLSEVFVCDVPINIISAWALERSMEIFLVNVHLGQSIRPIFWVDDRHGRILVPRAILVFVRIVFAWTRAHRVFSELRRLTERKFWLFLFLQRYILIEIGIQCGVLRRRWALELAVEPSSHGDFFYTLVY